MRADYQIITPTCASYQVRFSLSFSFSVICRDPALRTLRSAQGPVRAFVILVTTRALSLRQTAVGPGPCPMSPPLFEDLHVRGVKVRLGLRTPPPTRGRGAGSTLSPSRTRGGVDHISNF